MSCSDSDEEDIFDNRRGSKRKMLQEDDDEDSDLIDEALGFTKARSRPAPPAKKREEEASDSSDIDEDDEDLDAVLQPGRYKAKSTKSTASTKFDAAMKQKSREELMGEIYGSKSTRPGRKRKASVTSTTTTATSAPSSKTKRTDLEIQTDPSAASVGSVLKRSRGGGGGGAAKTPLEQSASRASSSSSSAAGTITLSDSDEDDDLEFGHLTYAPDDQSPTGQMPPAVLESLRLARESQALANRLRHSDPSALAAASPIRPTTTTTSSSAKPASSPSAAVLLSVQCPLTNETIKFRILKTQAFSLLLNEYIKKRKDQLNAYFQQHHMTEYVGNHKKLLEKEGGFVVKFDGMPVQASQTPQDFGMLEDETLQLGMPPPPSAWLGALEKEAGIKIPARTATLPTASASTMLAPEEDEEEDQNDGDFVILRLRREGQEEKFRIDKGNQFQKLHDSYCQKKRLMPAKVKFVFDGLPLNMRSTAEDEDMEDDDIVDVEVEAGAQLPAASSVAPAITTKLQASQPQNRAPSPEPAPASAAGDDGDFVILRVRRGAEEDKFRLKRSDPFKKLQEAYCKKKGLQSDTIKFVFDGLPLKSNQTADGQDMEDEDIIDVEDNK